MELFSRTQMISALESLKIGDSVGLGLYRQGYRQYGLDFWGLNVASEVGYFIDNILDSKAVHKVSMIDIGAGTGKNVLDFARIGINHAVAVEIDSIGISHLLNALIKLEEANLLPENKVTVVKDDGLRFLRSHNSQYDIVICYGLLHVFKQQEQLNEAINLIQKTVASGGYLIVQAITDKYPAPTSQPELEGVIIKDNIFETCFSEEQWKIVHTDNKDIEHSHAGADELHRHGSIRAIIQKLS
jgi:spermidine synthase